jgi:hypothetical protein
MFAEGIEIGTVWVLATLGGAGGVIAALFHLLISSKDREYALLLAQKDKENAELISVKKSYQEITQEALKSAVDVTNFYRAKEGKPPIIPVAPVVSESHSPSTAAQREAALIATMRATMAQVKVVTGQEPRQEPDHALEPTKPDIPK